MVNTGNDYTGDFLTAGTETASTTLDDWGSDSSGTYFLHEISNDATAMTLTGDDTDAPRPAARLTVCRRPRLTAPTLGGTR